MAHSEAEHVNSPSTYQPLLEGEIRLLEFDKKESRSRYLRFHTRRVSLSTSAAPPIYTAVSYAWGQSQPTESIYVDGRPVLIRPHLKECLKTLVEGTFGAYRRWKHVWVDSICINQSDTKERNCQVQMMAEIYAKAQAVSVWLKDTPDRKTVMTLPSWLRYGWMRMHKGGIKFASEIAVLPYWSRAWVVQEFLLGRTVHIYLGTMNLTDSKLHILFWRLVCYQLETVLKPIPHISYNDKGTDLVEARLNYRKDLIASHTLYSLLEQHAWRDCSEPRDKVFSFLSLVNQAEMTYLSQVLPDYALTLYQVTVVVMAHVKLFEKELQWMYFTDFFEALNVLSLPLLPRLLSCAAKLLPIYSQLSSSRQSIFQLIGKPETTRSRPEYVPHPDASWDPSIYLRFLDMTQQQREDFLYAGEAEDSERKLPA